MKDGTYTVKEVKGGKRKGDNEVIFKNMSKRDSIYTKNTSVQEGSIVTVRSNRIVAVKK
mgnify:CR=1 FL=1